MKSKKSEIIMPRIFTCGHPSKRTRFEYSGSVVDGIELIFDSGNAKVTANFLEALIKKFRGRTVPGGFSMTDPTPGGVGEWVANNSRNLNGSSLTPRHASFICGVLVHENFANSTLHGNAVIMEFNS